MIIHVRVLRPFTSVAERLTLRKVVLLFVCARVVAVLLMLKDVPPAKLPLLLNTMAAFPAERFPELVPPPPLLLLQELSKKAIDKTANESERIEFFILFLFMFYEWIENDVY
jgi:hypothetical protein